MNLRQRLLQSTDRMIAGLLVLLLAGTTVAFGGHVWWAPFALACLTLLLGAATLARILIEGNVRWLKSPLTALGLLAIGLAAFQLVPLPARLAATLSPSSHAVYAVGFLPERARALDPEVELPPPAVVRSPVSINRSATLRWLLCAVACLVVFWGTSNYADRLGRLFLVWGSVVGAFLLNTSLVVVQLVCGSRGLFGFLDPGRARRWAPNLVDLMESPGASVLRASREPAAEHIALAMAIPERPYLLGTQMGGPAAYLALGAVALPLTLALTLQVIAPRGSREALSARLAQTGQSSLVALLYGMLLASAAMIGLLAGPLFSVPFAVALALAGIPAARSSGLRWTGVGLTLLAIVLLATGAAMGELWATSTAFPMTVPRQSAEEAARVWSDSLPIARDFRWLGAGLGTFSSAYAFYKSQDATVTTAISSLLQWWIESGIAGMALIAVAGLWTVSRVPGAVRRVGTADRALAFGLIGAASGFTLFSAVHWTVELASVSLAASAVGGTLNRWLAGGTDLFIESGQAG